MGWAGLQISRTLPESESDLDFSILVELKSDGLIETVEPLR